MKVFCTQTHMVELTFISSPAHIIQRSKFTSNNVHLLPPSKCHTVSPIERHHSNRVLSMTGNDNNNMKKAKRQRAPQKYEPDDDDDDDDDMEVSRRVFIAGTTLSSLFTAAVSYRYFIGEDIDITVRRRLFARYPRFFKNPDAPSSGSPNSVQRSELNATFAKLYYDTLEKTAVQMKFIESTGKLHADEEELQSKSKRLFFYSDNDNSDDITDLDISNEKVFNFLVYTRLRVISLQTSPKSRVEFSASVAQQTLPALLRDFTPISVQDRYDAKKCNEWIAGVEEILKGLVSIGWISSYSVDKSNLDEAIWLEDRRVSVTVYGNDLLTMQAAQLIGEEAYEEMSPKVSPWIVVFLREYCGGIKVSAEDYYLDDVYRPDPAFYKPTIVATQFDLSFP